MNQFLSVLAYGPTLVADQSRGALSVRPRP
jgi:hypothetical protein